MSNRQEQQGKSADPIFEEQWAIYRKVIDHDYMGHGEIKNRLVDHFGGRDLGAVLDLGCGDAEISGHLIGQSGCRTYTGVDLSGAALGHAGRNLSPSGVQAEFVQGDILDYVTTAQRNCFDTVLAGFSVHHLAQDEKAQFFSAVAGLLKPAGTFLFYDVYLMPGMDRTGSIGKYLDWISDDWVEMTPREHELIKDHIWTCDFPESEKWIEGTARSSGFCEGERVAECCGGYHLATAYQLER